MPQKTFEFTRRTEMTKALDLSNVGSPQEALEKVSFKAFPARTWPSVQIPVLYLAAVSDPLCQAVQQITC